MYVVAVFLLDEDGIHGPTFQNSHEYFGTYASAGGTARFSPDGTKYALYNYTNQLHIYDFDRNTGLLSNHQEVHIYDPDSIDWDHFYFSSVEWSPNSRFLYCASNIKLHQVDTWEPNLQDGVRHIADYIRFYDPFDTEFFLLAQAPDCKVYLTPKNGSRSIHVINKPDELGKDCEFVQNGIKLPRSNTGAFPNFPRFRVDEVDKCDPTITSVFGDNIYYREDLSIYPNPSNGIYNIKIPENVYEATLVITNTHGQIIKQKEISKTLIEQVDITQMSAGYYNISIYPIDNDSRLYYGGQVVKM